MRILIIMFLVAAAAGCMTQNATVGDQNTNNVVAANTTQPKNVKGLPLPQRIAAWKERQFNLKAEEIVFIDKPDAEKYLQFIAKYKSKLQLLPASKRWRNGGAIGSLLVPVDDKKREFYVEAESEFNQATIFYRTVSSSGTFPRERTTFEYNYEFELGMIQYRFYEKEGAGVSSPTEGEEKLEELMGIADKIVGQ